MKIKDKYYTSISKTQINGYKDGIVCNNLNNIQVEDDHIIYNGKKYKNEIIFNINQLTSKRIIIDTNKNRSILIKIFGMGFIDRYSSTELTKSDFRNGYLDITTKISKKININSSKNFLRIRIVNDDNKAKHLLDLNSLDFSMEISYTLTPY